jgi:speckle-type POZ protein
MSETSSTMSETSSVSEDDNPSGNLTMDLLQFTWTIPNFLNATFADEFISPAFSVADEPGMKVCLSVCPFGPELEPLNWVAIYVQTKGSKKNDYECHVELAILDENREKFVSKQFYDTFPQHQSSASGYADFIHRSVLVNPLNKLLPSNTLTVFCRIESEPYRIRQIKKVTQQRRLVQDFGCLLDNKNNADVYFSFEDVEIGAHKTILAARSPVFAAMFQHDMQENKANKVKITDISSAVFGQTLHFIYTGQCKLKGIAEELFFVADKYQIEGLKQMCENHLHKNLKVDNAVRLLILSDMHQSSILKEHAIYFINRNAVEVRKTSSWKDLIKSHLHLLEELYNEIIDSKMDED